MGEQIETYEIIVNKLNNIKQNNSYEKNTATYFLRVDRT